MINRIISMGSGRHSLCTVINLDEAEKLVAETAELWKRKLGPEHLKTKMGLTYLVGLYHRQGKFEEVKTVYVKW